MSVKTKHVLLTPPKNKGTLAGGN
uniref:Uncharacterized protein n=1 Tax=Arundo donax TaxID=35708 RepID=A0A0A8ZIE1_ARUDO